MLPDPKSLYLRKWWWSQQPFWLYEDSRKNGWGHATDKHPGLFNLCWVAAGGIEPPKGYARYAEHTLWVLQEAEHIPMYGLKMADHAFLSSIKDFEAMLVDDRVRIKKYRFCTEGVSYELILDRVRKASGLARA